MANEDQDKSVFAVRAQAEQERALLLHIMEDSGLLVGAELEEQKAEARAGAEEIGRKLNELTQRITARREGRAPAEQS